MKRKRCTSPDTEATYGEKTIIQPRAHKTYLPFRGVDNDTSNHLPLEPGSKEIRYVALDPGGEDDPISCFLGYVDIAEPCEVSGRIEYQAVSYCWGDISETVEISLRCARDKSATRDSPVSAWIQQVYRITRNLEDLLRAFRSQDKHRMLWIDAICIAQSDPVEKTHQVGLMGTIYSSASQVLVWLGAGCLAFDILVRIVGILDEQKYFARYHRDEHLRQLYRQISIRYQSLAQLIAIDLHESAQDSTAIRRTHIDAFAMRDAIRRCIERCLSQPWFRRIWVLQEIVLAPMSDDLKLCVSVYMGKLSLHWHQLLEVAAYFGDMGYDSAMFHSKFFLRTWTDFSPISPSKRRSEGLSMEQYLGRTTEFLSSDPRDKVFALLSLAADTQSVFTTDPLLRPNYAKSFQGVLTDLQQWLLWNASEEVLHLPIARGTNAGTIIRCETRSPSPARAIDVHAPEGNHVVDDIVVALFKYVRPWTHDLPSWFSHLWHEESGFRAEWEPSFYGPRSENIFSMIGVYDTLHMCSSRQFNLVGKTLSSIIPKAMTELGDSYQLMCICHHIDSNGHEMLPKVFPRSDVGFNTLETLQVPFHMFSEIEKAEIEHKNHLLLSAFRAMLVQTICMTSTGELVLGPNDLLCGDRVTIIYGAPTPLLLRRKKNGQYLVIGPVFFFGDKWIHGEELRAHALDYVPDQTFEVVGRKP